MNPYIAVIVFFVCGTVPVRAPFVGVEVADIERFLAEAQTAALLFTLTLGAYLTARYDKKFSGLSAAHQQEIFKADAAVLEFSSFAKAGEQLLVQNISLNLFVSFDAAMQFETGELFLKPVNDAIRRYRDSINENKRNEAIADVKKGTDDIVAYLNERGVPGAVVGPQNGKLKRITDVYHAMTELLKSNDLKNKNSKK